MHLRRFKPPYSGLSAVIAQHKCTMSSRAQRKLTVWRASSTRTVEARRSRSVADWGWAVGSAARCSVAPISFARCSWISAACGGSGKSPLYLVLCCVEGAKAEDVVSFSGYKQLSPSACCGLPLLIGQRPEFLRLLMMSAFFLCRLGSAVCWRLRHLGRINRLWRWGSQRGCSWCRWWVLTTALLSQCRCRPLLACALHLPDTLVAALRVFGRYKADISNGLQQHWMLQDA